MATYQERRKQDRVSKRVAAVQAFEITLSDGQEKQVTVTTPDGLRFVLTLSNGPLGLHASIKDTSMAAGVLSYETNSKPDAEVTVGDAYFGDISASHYRYNPTAQAFKKWYQCNGTKEERNALYKAYEALKESRTEITTHQHV